MNKYQKAINTIHDTLAYYKIYKDSALLHSDNEIYGAIAVLAKLVSKEKSQEWIPVSKKLPESPKENPEFDYKPLDIYLVSVSDEKYPFRAFWDGKQFGDGMFKLDVKAWMPLPEPYMENEDER